MPFLEKDKSLQMRELNWAGLYVPIIAAIGGRSKNIRNSRSSSDTETA